jgi:hypothetical protein
MNYTHIEDPKKPVVKDFLVELAKSVDLIQNCGVKSKKTRVELSLSPEEFDKAFNHFSQKVPTYADRPKREFKINFSGVEVKFIKD